MTSIILVYFFAILAFLTNFSAAKSLGGYREKREPATIVTGAIAGVIGNLGVRTPSVNPTVNGGCEWFGTAPFCDGVCPQTYHFMRREVSAPRGERSTFGHGCATGKKAYCCKSDGADCEWTGNWISGKFGHHYHCQFEADVSTFDALQQEMNEGVHISSQNCGTLRCASTRPSKMVDGRVKIEGERCETLYGLFGNGTTTIAICGLMTVNGGEDYLFKTRG